MNARVWMPGPGALNRRGDMGGEEDDRAVDWGGESGDGDGGERRRSRVEKRCMIDILWVARCWRKRGGEREGKQYFK